MILRINGKAEEVKAASTLAELILSKGLSAERVVVEHNHSIIRQEELANIRLHEDDHIEIVSFVGGG